ncbi:hypothetical protein F5I97DRAFT_1993976, partial [Phlebopus sp. FC_14]
DVRGSPVKGKARDDGRWSAGWWDFHPLAEHIQKQSLRADLPVFRPVAWASSSTIFTAHPTQPLILGRLFPSSKQFLVVSPDPVLRSPASYEPPTVISISPNDRWLFAFYPAREGDGVACLWQRGIHIDSWIVRECWPFSRGAGVVSAAWPGADREWVAFTDGSSSRLPPRGPLTPLSDPTLLLVTQAHQLHVCYMRAYNSSFKMLCCSLTQPYFTAEGQILGAVHDTPSGPKTSRLCVNADIGFVYNATHNDLDLGLSLDLSQDPSPEEQSPPLEWGTLAEEPIIELCEVKLRFDGSTMTLLSHPLPPLHYPSPHLIDLMFVCTPPQKPDPVTSPNASPKKDKQPQRPEPASTFLVTSFLDFDDYSSTPTCQMVAFSVVRVPPSAPQAKPAWSIRQVGERSFFPRVLTLFAPGWVSTNLKKATVIAMIADTSGLASRGGQKTKEVPVGNIAILQLPDLLDDPAWGRSSFLSPSSRAGMDWPVSIAVSKNRILLCALSLGRTSLHPLPRPHVKGSEPGGRRCACTVLDKSHLPEEPAHNFSPLSMALTVALQSRRSIADIAHVLAMSATPLDTLADTLSGVLFAFETNARAGSVNRFTPVDILGAAVEIYRARALQSTDEDDKDYLTSLWRNAHDMCSLAACLAAFEDCKEPEGYDLEAVWQLVSLSSWVVGFLEKLLKECLSLADLTNIESNPNEIRPKAEPVDENDSFLCNDLPRSRLSSPFDSPILLHLIHPLTLGNLIGVTIHVNRFYQTISSLSAKGENAQIARDILLDLVTCSGLNLKELEAIFKSAVPDVRAIPGEESRSSLARCHPVPAQHGTLKKIIQALYVSTAIDKPRLFIKPFDLVDGFANLSTSDRMQKEQDKDVVTKGSLLRRGPGLVCLRCGHRSEIGGGMNVSLKWRSWERTWMTRCICGGAWSSG